MPEHAQSDELPTGPPLDCVAEKFRHCLEGLHGTIHEIERGSGTEATTTDADQDDLVSLQAKYAFQSAIVGYFALVLWRTTTTSAAACRRTRGRNSRIGLIKSIRKAL